MSYPRLSRAARGCSVEGCERPHDSRGLCKAHSAQARAGQEFRPVVQRHGPEWRARVSSAISGEKNHHWIGDRAGYVAAHQRIRKVRGNAPEHSCCECGERAAHWSLSWRRVPREQLRFSAKGSPYSLDHADYDPRCFRCAFAYDKEWQALA